MAILPADDPVAVALGQAIRAGDSTALQRLPAEDPGRALVHIQGRNGSTRTPLHIATDWPGYFPRDSAVVGLLIDAGADPNAPVTGSDHAETPLHWDASGDASIASGWSMVGGRRQRSYELTTAGRAVLGEQRSAWREFAHPVSALMDPWGVSGDGVRPPSGRQPQELAGWSRSTWPQSRRGERSRWSADAG
ncbi:hypothetical protein [Pseudonocardia sp. GCM10023141]|uniref:hypothetical protein n=1 Tax=Pseudonocardia sp. GCM10023141 TaxID=3252653 RepID=UPI0036178E2B